jgi:hypothetical protein
LFSFTSVYTDTEDRDQSVVFMSSTAQATSSASDIQSIIDAALADYAKITGIDPSASLTAAAFEHSDSPEAILQLLQGRENAFIEYRDDNRSLINCLSPALKVIHAFSGILGGGNLVSFTYTYQPANLLTGPRQTIFPPANALFVGIDTLLAVRPLNMLLNVPFNSSIVMYEYARLPVVLHQATMPYSTSLSAWEIS